MVQLGRSLRSPRTLLIFEAAARCGSCSAAAREFNLTQPSVSRNIAELEQALATTLFVRKSSGLELTADGQVLFRAVSEALHRIDDALADISRRNARKQVVELSFSTAFVTHWFVPRMHEFHQAFPEVDIRFQLTSGALKGPTGSVDLAMRRMNGGEAETDRCWVFCPELVMAVASKTYLARHGTLTEERPGEPHVLLELLDTEIGWEAWLAAARTRSSRHHWMEFSDYAVTLQTAIGGQGIALGWISAVSRMLIEATLVPAAPHLFETERSFNLVAPRGRPVRAIVLGIRDWLIAQMRRDLVTLSPMLEAAREWRKAPIRD
jgi:DNA-binding transcriptional LysR family regulator